MIVDTCIYMLWILSHWPHNLIELIIAVYIDTLSPRYSPMYVAYRWSFCPLMS